MAGPEVMELGQGRLMSNSGRSDCLVQVYCAFSLPVFRQEWQRQADGTELTSVLAFSQSTVGEKCPGHVPGEGKEVQASGESTGPGLHVVGPDLCLPA